MMRSKAKKLAEQALDIADDELDKAVLKLVGILRQQLDTLVQNGKIEVLEADKKVALGSILGKHWLKGEFDAPMLDDLLAAQYLLGFPFSTIMVR